MKEKYPHFSAVLTPTLTHKEGGRGLEGMLVSGILGCNCEG